MVKTMFGPAKYDYLSKAISINSVRSARASVIELNNMFRSASTRTKKLRIARATMLASNRALASRKRTNLSADERRQFKEIAGIYSRVATRMFNVLKSQR